MTRPQQLVVIGNFDGVHIGHQALLRSAAAWSNARNLGLLVLTFDPHPAAVLGRPGRAPTMLTTLLRKRQILHALGVDVVHVEPFTEAFSQQSPEAFVRDLLVTRLAAGSVLVGSDFRFGKGRAGSFADLELLAGRAGVEVRSFDLLAQDGMLVSSTHVREAIAQGELGRVRALLGREHQLTGTVQKGAQRGRTLGFPTANLGRPPEALPPYGVYAVRVSALAGAAWQTLGNGVMNLGVRPTVSGDPSPTVEVHLFDSPGDIYGAELLVDVVTYVREERAFAGLEQLRTQISHDVDAAKRAMLDQNHGE